MAFSLFGPSFPFCDLFARQCGLLHEAASELDALFRDFGKGAPHALRIRELERESHETFRAITRELALTLIRPLERGDVHDLNLAFDGVLQAVASVAARASLYGFRGSREAARDLSEDLKEMAQQIAAMLEQLRRSESVTDESREVERLKNEADKLLLVALGELFEDEGGARPDPLEVLRWTHLYDRIEEALDRTERIAVILESIVLKQT